MHNLCAQPEDRTNWHGAGEGDAVEREEFDVSAGEQARVGEAQLCLQNNVKIHNNFGIWVFTNFICQSHEVASKDFLVHTTAKFQGQQSQV
jgi:hypothetical protein